MLAGVDGTMTGMQVLSAEALREQMVRDVEGMINVLAAALRRRTRASVSTLSVNDPALRQALQKELGKEFKPGVSYVALDMSNPLLANAMMNVMNRVPEIVEARRTELSQQNIDTLVDAYLRAEPAADVRHELELDNARERARFRESYPCYTSREVAEFAGHRASNTSATAGRWKKSGRVLALPWKDGDLYPSFQFVDGAPIPIIARLLAILVPRLTPWQIAFWLTSPNGWLDGSRPCDRLEDGDAVTTAATQEADTLLG